MQGCGNRISKRMKKKIALLLAAVMLLSLVPSMNLFGARLGLDSSVLPTVNFNQNITEDLVTGAPELVRRLVINASDFGTPVNAPEGGPGVPVLSRAILTIDNNAQWIASYMTLSPTTVSTPSGSSLTVQLIPIDVDGNGRTTQVELVVTADLLRINGVLDPGIASLNYAVPLQYRTGNDRTGAIRVSIINIQGRFTDHSVNIANYRSTRFNVGFSSGAVRNFETRITLTDPITISEGVLGAFNTTGAGNRDVIIRLDLPRGFYWTNANYMGGSASVGRVNSVAAAGGTGLNVTSTRSTFGLDIVTREAVSRGGNNNNSRLEFRLGMDGAIPVNRTIDTINIGVPRSDTGLFNPWENRFTPPNGLLQIAADDNARPGPVQVEIRMSVDGGVSWLEWGSPIGTVTVATYAREGILVSTQNALPLIRSGSRLASSTATTKAWDENTDAGTNRPYAVSGADGNILATARVVIQENTPGSWALTGLHDTEFRFSEGVQVLGVRAWHNNAGFVRAPATTQNGVPQSWNTVGEVWSAWDSAVSVGQRSPIFEFLIRNDVVYVRPEVTQHVRTAIMMFEFYLSVEPGYVAKYGTDEIMLNVSGRALGDREFDLPVAKVWDPIVVETDPIVIDEVMDASFGRVRNTPVNDVTIFEASDRAWRLGDSIWIGIETGVSIRGNTADQVALNVASVEVVGNTGLRVSRPVRIDDGVYVRVERESNGEGAALVFKGVEISGALVYGNQYDLIVGGSAVSDNWMYDFDNNLQATPNKTNVGRFTYGAFRDDPYPTLLFEFGGAEHYAPAPAPAPEPAPAPGPVTIAEPEQTVLRFEIGNPIFTRNGVPMAAVDGVAPYIDAAAGRTMLPLVTVANALGATTTWDDATRTVTVLRNGTSVSLVLGQPLPGGMGTSVSVNGRTMVPVAFVADQLGAVTVWSEVERAVYIFD
jgi:hypothetical protein